MKQRADGQAIIHSTWKCIKMYGRGIDCTVELGSTFTGSIDVSTTASGSFTIRAQNYRLPDNNRPSKFWRIVGIVLGFVPSIINIITSRKQILP